MKKTFFKRLVTLGVVAGLMSTMIGCGSNSTNSDKETTGEAASETTNETETASNDAEYKGTIKFGLIAPLTGTHAEYGQGFDAATQLAVEDINNNGGANGYKLEIEVQDSAAEPKVSSDIATQFAEDDEIMGIIGDFTSSCCMANAPICDQYGILQLSPTASNPDYASMSEYCFTVMYEQATAAPWVGESVIGHYMGVSNIAIMYLNTDWGISTNDYLLQGLESAGVDVLADEAYEETETDFSSVIAKLKASGAEAVCILDQGNVPTIVNQIRSIGWDTKLVTLGPGASDQLLDLCGENANGLVLPCPSYVTEDNPVTTEFYQRFYAINDCAPTDYALCAYNCVMMLADAINDIGDGEITRETLKDSLKTASYEGMSGLVEFNEDGGCDRQLLIMEVVDGKYEIKEEYGYQ